MHNKFSKQACPLLLVVRTNLILRVNSIFKYSKLPDFLNKEFLMPGFIINTMRIRSFDGLLIYSGQV